MYVIPRVICLLSQALQLQYPCSGPGLFTWPTRINKGGQFRLTDISKKSVTVDRQGGHVGKKAKVKCTTVLVFAVQSWPQDQVIIM